MIIGGIPLAMLNRTSPVWVIVVAYAVRLIGIGLAFSPAISESFKELTIKSFSHGSALNNSLQQAGGALAVTILVIIDDAAATPVKGMSYAMLVTILLAVVMLIIHLCYICKHN